MRAPTHRAPPLVRVTMDGVRLFAYLLEWVGQDGEKARVWWVEQYAGEPYQWRAVEADLPRDSVELLEGQAYAQVPQSAGGVREPEREEDTRTWRQQSRGDRS
ncbi:hypothetical protein Q8791_23375 [Nocardiopsis sp. CT-R113]|uniref:Uncharacterized protein n=1 Tax=Nocardiopsis codii TaxID=3065942 RepID=A0ABU7KDQ2_9ACTN|nr:hypothetical protein [Nocardiopsis sp. CT-R113]MEE2040162.1 hypothetical protein [Nocardiopsis sp. CT-R113]